MSLRGIKPPRLGRRVAPPGAVCGAVTGPDSVAAHPRQHLGRHATMFRKYLITGLLIWLPLNPEEVALDDGFSRDVRGVGHHGTGDLELTIRNLDDLNKAKPFIQKSFEEN